MKSSEQPIYPNQWNSQEKGLTKREYFAAMAMQGLLSADAKYNGRTDNREALAKDAIAHADELLKKLENQ